MFRCIFIIFSLFFAFSCAPTQLVGSWEFVEIYNGEVHQIDSLKKKNNISKFGTGILTFYKDKTFNSLGDIGNYQLKNNVLEMKYDDSKDTIPMKISYISKEYLLLSSMKNSLKTWVYKKTKHQ